MLPQLLRLGLDEGLSGNQMLGQMRDVGYAIRTQDFYQVLGEVSSAASMARTWPTLDPTQIPALTDFTPLSVPRGTGLMYRFEALVRDQQGNFSWLPRAMRDPNLIAPADLMQEWLEAFTESETEAQPSSGDLAVFGMRLSGLYQLMPSA